MVEILYLVRRNELVFVAVQLSKKILQGIALRLRRIVDGAHVAVGEISLEKIQHGEIERQTTGKSHLAMVQGVAVNPDDPHVAMWRSATVRLPDAVTVAVAGDSIPGKVVFVRGSHGEIRGCSERFHQHLSGRFVYAAEGGRQERFK